MRDNKTQRRGLPTRLGAPGLLAGALAALGATSGARAIEINTGNPDIGLRWDNTIRYNISTRVENKDAKIANAPNTDESDNKFDSGDIVNNRVDLLTELDLVYKSRIGLRVSAAAWYDPATTTTT